MANYYYSSMDCENNDQGYKVVDTNSNFKRESFVEKTSDETQQNVDYMT